MSVNPTLALPELEFESEKVEEHKLNILIYGDQGVGKTTLAATMENHPLMSPCVFGNIEGGSLALKNAGIVGIKRMPKIFQLVDPKDPEPTPKKTLARLETLYWYLRGGNHPFKSVCLDTLGELVTVHINATVALAVEQGKRPSIYDVQLQDWNVNKSYITYWLRKFRDLPMHVVVTCHKGNYTRADGVEVISPELPPKLIQPVCRIFDLVGYMTLENREIPDPKSPGQTMREPQRKLTLEYQSGGNLIIIAKDRSAGGKAGKEIWKPNLPGIFNRIIATGEPAKAALKTTATTDTEKEAA